MAVVIPTGYAQVTIHWDGALIPDGEGATVFGLKLVPDPDLASVCAAVGTAWMNIFAGSMSENLILTSVSAVTATAVAESPVLLAGEGTGSDAPPNVALHIRKLTALRGRRAQGHMYLPGLLYAQQLTAQGQIVANKLTGTQAQVDQLLTDLPGGMVILQGDGGVTPPISPPPLVTRLQVDPIISTQRKRLR